jgi:hypothetical protein
MIERRKLERLPLRCPVSLWRPTDGIFTRTMTENLSSDGFYCLSSEFFALGDELEARLEIPDQHPDHARPERGKMAALALQCRIEVVRAEDLGEKRGLGCRIKEYFATQS